MARSSNRRAFYKVIVNGQDVTSRFDPYLLSVTVTDYDGKIDACEIDLDDSHGVLALPPDRSKIAIELGWSDEAMISTFAGNVERVESYFQRKSGRALKVIGKGADMFSLGKQPMTNSFGEGPAPGGGAPAKLSVKDVLEKAAKAAGYELKIGTDLGSITRDYWAQTGESFHSFANRLAREIGGTLKIAGNVASITSSTNNFNVNGKNMPDVEATWGKNLIAWRIEPRVGRPSFAETARQFFDVKEGRWRSVVEAVGGGVNGLTKAIHTGLIPVATEDAARQTASSEASQSMRKVGFGWVVIDGEPAAAGGANCIVKGARAGVDGTYRIVEAEHTFYRRGGYQTRLQVEQPGATVGQDFRGETGATR